MSYELLGSNNKYWTCQQGAWGFYLDLAAAFGWLPEGAFFKWDEGGFREHPSGSYIGNDWQIVTDTDARAMAAAFNLAVATISAGSPITDDQVTALEAFEIDDSDPFQNVKLTKGQQTALLKLQTEHLASHPDEIRTIHTRTGTFAVDFRGMMDLADLATAGGFTIA